MSEHHLPMTTGALVVGAGAWGYAKSRSVPALVGGLALGAAYGASAVLLQRADSSADRASAHQLGQNASIFATGVAASLLLRSSTRPIMMRPVGAVVGLACAVDTLYQHKKYSEWQDAAIDEALDDEAEAAAAAAMASIEKGAVGANQDEERDRLMAELLGKQTAEFESFLRDAQQGRDIIARAEANAKAKAEATTGAAGAAGAAEGAKSA